MNKRGGTVVRNIRFPIRDWRELQRRAKQADREIAWLVRLAVKEMLDRKDGAV